MVENSQRSSYHSTFLSYYPSIKFPTRKLGGIIIELPSHYHPMLLNSPIYHLPSIQYQNSRKNPPGSNPNTLISSTELLKPHSHSRIHLNILICLRQLSRKSHTISTTSSVFDKAPLFLQSSYLSIKYPKSKPGENPPSSPKHPNQLDLCSTSLKATSIKLHK